MSNLNVTEYAEIAKNSLSAPIAAAKEPSITVQNVTFTTATPSSAFNADTRFVRVISDADCHVAFGSDPTATTSSTKLKADIEYYFGVTAGHKVSVVSA